MDVRENRDSQREQAAHRIRWILRIGGAVIIFFGGVNLLAFVVIGGRGNLIEGLVEVAGGTSIVCLGRWFYRLNMTPSEPWPGYAQERSSGPEKD
jgi:hypothetical protein